MDDRSRAGFTLIELLVVIAILGILATALLPRVLEGRKKADIFADEMNMKWHYQNFMDYRDRKHSWPREGGHRFVLAPWVMEICEHTETNRDRYFTPGLMAEDPRYAELRERDPREIWRSFDELTSEDTHYAGRAAEHYRGMWSGNEALMANDNEFDNTFSDGTINVLTGDGNVKQLFKAEHLKQWWPVDDGNYVFPVGPESPHPQLQKLAK